MTLGAVKQATGILALVFLVAAVFAVFSGFGQIFGGHVFRGFAHISASIAALGFFYVVVRMLAEILAALHRVNDRLLILGDDLRVQRADPVNSGSSAEA